LRFQRQIKTQQQRSNYSANTRDDDYVQRSFTMNHSENGTNWNNTQDDGVSTATLKPFRNVERDSKVFSEKNVEKNSDKNNERNNSEILFKHHTIQQTLSQSNTLSAIEQMINSKGTQQNTHNNEPLEQSPGFLDSLLTSFFPKSNLLQNSNFSSTYSQHFSASSNTQNNASHKSSNSSQTPQTYTTTPTNTSRNLQGVNNAGTSNEGSYHSPQSATRDFSGNNLHETNHNIPKNTNFYNNSSPKFSAFKTTQNTQNLQISTQSSHSSSNPIDKTLSGSLYGVRSSHSTNLDLNNPPNRTHSNTISLHQSPSNAKITPSNTNIVKHFFPSRLDETSTKQPTILDKIHPNTQHKTKNYKKRTFYNPYSSTPPTLLRYTYPLHATSGQRLFQSVLKRKKSSFNTTLSTPNSPLQTTPTSAQAAATARLQSLVFGRQKESALSIGNNGNSGNNRLPPLQPNLLKPDTNLCTNLHYRLYNSSIEELNTGVTHAQRVGAVVANEQNKLPLHWSFTSPLLPLSQPLYQYNISDGANLPNQPPAPAAALERNSSIMTTNPSKHMTVSTTSPSQVSRLIIPNISLSDSNTNGGTEGQVSQFAPPTITLQNLAQQYHLSNVLKLLYSYVLFSAHAPESNQFGYFSALARLQHILPRPMQQTIEMILKANKIKFQYVAAERISNQNSTSDPFHAHFSSPPTHHHRPSPHPFLILLHIIVAVITPRHCPTLASCCGVMVSRIVFMVLLTPFLIPHKAVSVVLIFSQRMLDLVGTMLGQCWGQCQGSKQSEQSKRANLC